MALNVWMNGVLVGSWEQSRSGTAVFKYDADWITSETARPLSLSLPITTGISGHRGSVVSNYFENLLPDSQDIRNRIRARYQTHSTEAFDLLTAIGRDCVGAVQLLPTDATPEGWDQVNFQPLNEAQVAQQLRAATSPHVVGRHTNRDEADFRISIAGAQEKTALLRFGNQWHIPVGATPTTHILKLPLGLVGGRNADMRTSVPNEWLCSKILKGFGLPVANTDMAQFEDQRVLVVERFDRRWQAISPGAQDKPGFKPQKSVWIARVPQEDFCQIAGLPPTAKYEADGGPGIAKALSYLGNSANEEADKATFVLTQLSFWLLAATDGHAKNFSIAINRGGSYQLTPLYDVLSAWPVIGKRANMLALQDVKMAMAMRSKSAHYGMEEIRVRHWMRLAHDCGVQDMWERMLIMVEGVDQALATAMAQLPESFPQQVWDSIEKGMKRQAGLFLREYAKLQTA